jgi:acyl-CoA reductase-like NAD-dependent aldehyde dehydrogenase
MPKGKVSALLSLVFVFVSGALVGAVGHRLYTVKTVTGSTSARPPRPDPEEIRRRLVAEMRDKVKLDPQQVTQLNRIYDETRQNFDELHKRANAETRKLWDTQTDQIRAILHPDQVSLYEQLRAQREQERQRHRQQNPPPPGRN